MTTKDLIFHQLFEPESSTYTYIVGDLNTKECVIIDPVLETSARDLALIKEQGLKIKYSLETHLHADHITGAAKIRKATGAKTVISAISKVSCADIHLNDNDVINVGSLTFKALSTPGHTSTCMCFQLNDMVFTGDTLMIGVVGRTDFQSGSPEVLYESIHKKLFSLPDSTTVYPAHDYKGVKSSTIGNEKKTNARIGGGKTKDEFKNIMDNLNLPQPKKINQALPANMVCGDIE